MRDFSAASPQPGPQGRRDLPAQPRRQPGPEGHRDPAARGRRQPGPEGFGELQRGLADTPAPKGLESPAPQSPRDPAARVADSPVLGRASRPSSAAAGGQPGRLKGSRPCTGTGRQPGAQGPRDPASAAYQLVAAHASRRRRDFYEAAVRRYEEHWADVKAENPADRCRFSTSYSSFGRGRRIAALHRSDRRDTTMRVLLERWTECSRDEVFVGQMQAAIPRRPALERIRSATSSPLSTGSCSRSLSMPIRRSTTGWSGALCSREGSGVIDDRNRFLAKSGKAHKLDDVLDDVLGDLRFKRFLRALGVWGPGQSVPTRRRARRQRSRSSPPSGMALVGRLERVSGRLASLSDLRWRPDGSTQRSSLRQAGAGTKCSTAASAKRASSKPSPRSSAADARANVMPSSTSCADLFVGVAGDGPAVDVGRFGPPAVGFAVVEDSDGHGCLRVA